MSFSYRLAAFTLCCLFPLILLAQPKPKIPRVLFLLDGSSSMSEAWKGERTRFEQAGRFIMTLMDSLEAANSSVEFGLRVFGHQYPAQQKNCYDTKREVNFFKGNRAQMQLRLESLHGYGVSPIAFSLGAAAGEDFSDEQKYAYSIVLVTDGGESCGGDICKVVNELLERKIFFRPYIVSLVDYAPLRELYACLGSFLVLSKEQELPGTIHKIVDAHREGFERAKTGTRIDVLRPAAVAPEQAVLKPLADTTPAAPAIARDKRTIRRIRIPLVLKRFSIGAEELPMPQLLVVPPFVWSKTDMPVLEEAPRKPGRPFNRLPQSRPLLWPRMAKAPPAPKLPVPPFLLSKLADTAVTAATAVRVSELPAIRKKEKSFSRLAFSRPARLSSVPPPRVARLQPVPPFVWSKTDTTVRAVAIVPVSRPPAVVAKPPVTLTKPATNTPSPYRSEKEAAEETLLEVFFTDGQGKFYTTSPQIQLSDPATGKQVHRFYRTVNPEGNPDPKPIPAGTYNLTVVGSDRTFIKSLVVTANMKNKIVITVSAGSLQFAYQASNSRLNLDKYFAIVKRNFEPLPVVKQRCDTILPYPPGNYHIEINTLPPSARSVDLSFGTVVVIGIDEPGQLAFTNTDRLGKVVLFYQYGDKFVPFYTIDITGNPEQQAVELKPGIYEVHYFTGMDQPGKVLVFHIYSNKKTAIELQ